MHTKTEKKKATHMYINKKKIIWNWKLAKSQPFKYAFFKICTHDCVFEFFLLLPPLKKCLTISRNVKIWISKMRDIGVNAQNAESISLNSRATEIPSHRPAKGKQLKIKWNLGALKIRQPLFLGLLVTLGSDLMPQFR
jgi:hypothetical protein